MPILKQSRVLSASEQLAIESLEKAGVPVSELLIQKLVENPTYVDDLTSLLIDIKATIDNIHLELNEFFYERFVINLSQNINDSKISKWHEFLPNIEALVWFKENNFEITPSLSASLLADPELILPMVQCLTYLEGVVSIEQINGNNVFDENFLYFILTELYSDRENSEVESDAAHIFNLVIPINPQVIQDSEIDEKVYKLDLIMAIALLKNANIDVNDVMQNTLGQCKNPMEFAEVCLTLSRTNISLEKNIPNILAFLDEHYGSEITFAKDYANEILNLSQHYILTDRIFRYFLQTAQDGGDQLSNALINLNNAQITLDDDVLKLLSIKPNKSGLIAQIIISWSSSGLFNDVNKKLLTETKGLSERIKAIQRLIYWDNPLDQSDWSILFNHPKNFDKILKCLLIAAEHNVNTKSLLPQLIQNSKNIDTVYDAIELLRKGQQLTNENINVIYAQDNGRNAIISAINILSHTLSVKQFDELLQDPILQDIKNIINSATAFASFQKQILQRGSLTSIPQLPLSMIATFSGSTHITQQSAENIADAYFTRSQPELLQIFSPHRNIINKQLSKGVPISDKLTEKLLHHPELVDDFVKLLNKLNTILEKDGVTMDKKQYEVLLSGLLPDDSNSLALGILEDRVNCLKNAMSLFSKDSFKISPSLTSCLLTAPDDSIFMGELLSQLSNEEGPTGRNSDGQIVFNESFLADIEMNLKSLFERENNAAKIEDLFYYPHHIDPKTYQIQGVKAHSINLIIALALLKSSNLDNNQTLVKAMSQCQQPMAMAQLCVKLSLMKIDLNEENLRSMTQWVNERCAWDKKYSETLTLATILNDQYIKYLEDLVNLDTDKNNLFRCFIKIHRYDTEEVYSALLKLQNQKIMLTDDILKIFGNDPMSASIIATDILITFNKKGLLNDVNKKIIIQTDNFAHRIECLSKINKINPTLDISQWKKLFDHPEQFDCILSCLMLAHASNINPNTLVNLMTKNINHLDSIHEAMIILSRCNQLTMDNINLMCEQNNGQYALIYAVERMYKTLSSAEFKELMTDKLMQEINHHINPASNFERQSLNTSEFHLLNNAEYLDKVRLSRQSKEMISDIIRSRNPDFAKIFLHHQHHRPAITTEMKPSPSDKKMP